TKNTEEADETTSDSQETHNEKQDPRNRQRENLYGILDSENDNQSETDHGENYEDEQILGIDGQPILNQNQRKLQFPISGLIDFDVALGNLLQFYVLPWNTLDAPLVILDKPETEANQIANLLTIPMISILVQKKIFQKREILVRCGMRFYLYSVDAATVDRHGKPKYVQIPVGEFFRIENIANPPKLLLHTLIYLFLHPELDEIPAEYEVSYLDQNRFLMCFGLEPRDVNLTRMHCHCLCASGVVRCHLRRHHPLCSVPDDPLIDELIEEEFDQDELNVD
ncbi:MAG: hypothetical protein EZS28_038824, partial [Streblomastix strix]